MKIASIVLALVGSVGCGDDGSAIDGGNVPAMITVTGTASDIGLNGRMPLPGVTIAAYKEGATTPVAMTTSGADGTYSLDITTNGEALDGYVKGTISGYKDTYLYPSGPLRADQPGASILMLTQGTFDLASTLAQGGQTPGMAFIGIQVYDGSMMGVGGVTLSSQPAGTVRYNGSNGLPASTGGMTMADGLGYVFNVAPGNVTLMASGGGMTFKSHTVNARMDQVTTTLMQP
jgi:hypothetical protein